MGAQRLIWHVGFERNLRRRGSRAFEVKGEFLLSNEAARIDCLLLRKVVAPVDDAPETLRGLWPLLPYVAVIEYKSPSRPYRHGNLDRLWGYVHTYGADQRELPRRRADGTDLCRGMDGAPDVWARADLCAVLVVPSRTPSLLDDTGEQGLGWRDLGGGYWRVEGGLYTLYVVEIDVVAPAEGDDLLYSLGHGDRVTPETAQFWMELIGSKESGMNVQDMEGYQELVRKLMDIATPEERLAGLAPEERLAGLAPEERLAGLAPEERLAGLDRDHQALALPVEVLRVLPEDYLRSLSPAIQAEIRRRIQQRDH
ncbi:MAG: hypothetical protein U0359_30955 [Byssovorax sp.]